jgi:hypothetical protein
MTPPKRGRPRIDPEDDSVQVSVTLPARQFDQMYKAARREEVSIAEAIRRRLDARPADDRDED